MTTIDASGFDPFFHEIVAIDQSDDPAAPMEITDTVWPGLMLGELLFSRAGVRVRAGALHAQTGVAEQSTLYEVFLRRHWPPRTVRWAEVTTHSGRPTSAATT